MKHNNRNLLKFASEIIEKAHKNNILLRLFGSIGVIYHCPKFYYLLESMARKPKDLDLIGLHEQKRGIIKFFLNRDYELDKYIALLTDAERLSFKNPENIDIEVQIDKIDFCHAIDLRNRLKLDYPTITLADLILSKLQIIEINKRDIEDIWVLILEHEVGEIEEETINSKYISKLLSKKWGFYYTVKNNLEKVAYFLRNNNFLSNSQKSNIKKKINKILLDIDNEKKSIVWKIRAKIGTKIKWYKYVSEE